MYTQMIAQFKEMLSALSNDRVIPAAAAKIYMNALNAFMAEGFTREEAMAIIVHQGVNCIKNNG